LFLVLVVFMLFAIPACAEDINLSAAASLRESVTELSNIFAKNNSGVKFQNNFGTCRQQVMGKDRRLIN
jgi:ABC-type molybdate transport system substrate-binding protein